MKPALIISTCAALAACTTGETPAVESDIVPEYGTVQTKLLEGNLVSFDVNMRGAASEKDVLAFTDCVAAQYALIRGSGFARRVRNDVSRQRGNWIGQGVYTLSSAHPGGRYVIDAEVTAADCRANNIPMV
ncbi:hypothetical protein [Neptunicoccus sediminis]|uniref:hypothetical protein n=1 Tax=Neptunicoccus sediminis TaxID=1892596 RepID=UPI000D525BD7|nr:hypothetical protein [Neptunicoccus sediminis]